ncbi:unnamed protein product [Schistosoma mattheei]|uniref:Uncharacterized protein n=1 Tax=Schistosoma mattheei TaxID=31246 RepID=A0A183Q7V3_9TREM|nr:unnamed protein product [Schistosoma mattheei]
MLNNSSDHRGPCLLRFTFTDGRNQILGLDMQNKSDLNLDSSTRRTYNLVEINTPCKFRTSFTQLHSTRPLPLRLGDQTTIHLLRKDIYSTCRLSCHQINSLLKVWKQILKNASSTAF